MNLFSYIKSQVSILDVVKEYATLKKAGSYWKGSCPFHSEKTASFTVSPHKEIFYCFGCHSGGDVISFMAKVENCSPIEAAQQLVERYQLTIPDALSVDKNNSTEKRNVYFRVYETVARWCVQSLKKQPSVLRYLHDRGIDQKSIELFMIGVFPGGVANMRAFTDAMRRESILPDDLLQAHIIAQGKTIFYSPFENRIIFPIRDHLGRFCGFGGRIYLPNDERAKYYNSRETEFFIKGSLLFGLDKAKTAIQTSGNVFLVEGYTDCIAMVQHGYADTVATLGTACTIDHLTALARYAQQVLVLYDSDRAGQEAIIRLTELCWQVNLELKVVCLPTGEDPASFLIQGGDLKPLVQGAKDIFEFFIMSAGKGFADKSLSEKMQITRRVIAMIGRVNDPLKQDILLQQASKILNISISSLKKGSREAAQPEAPARPLLEAPVRPPIDLTSEDRRLEIKLFFAIMSNLQLLNDENANYLIEYLPTPLSGIIKRLHEARKVNPVLDFVQFFDMVEKTEQQQISHILVAFDADVKSDEFDQLLIALQKKNWKQIVHSMQVQLAREEENADKEKVEKIIKSFLELKKKIVHKNLI
jgi:DNA primase